MDELILNQREVGASIKVNAVREGMLGGHAWKKRNLEGEGVQPELVDKVIDRVMHYPVRQLKVEVACQLPSDDPDAPRVKTIPELANLPASITGGLQELCYPLKEEEAPGYGGVLAVDRAELISLIKRGADCDGCFNPQNRSVEDVIRYKLEIVRVSGPLVDRGIVRTVIRKITE